MNYRPTAAELLDAIAELLETEVLAAVPAELQHKVRVAGNLSRILQREWLLEPAARQRELSLLAGLLGHEGDIGDLRAELSDRLSNADGGGDADFERRAWDVLVAVARDDLAVVKPGHDGWEGE